MVYLLLGEDFLSKEQKIFKIKKKIISSSQAEKFDYDLLYGSKLKPETLKKVLLSLPIISSQRMVIVKSSEKLSKHNIEIILKFIETREEKVVLVLDFDVEEAKNSFIKTLSQTAKIFKFYKGKKKNVFDMTNLMARRNSKEALLILETLLSEGDSPLKIMGGLVWFWGKIRNKLSFKTFEKGLAFLQETDLNIKRTRVLPQYALEILVVKLTNLL